MKKDHVDHIISQWEKEMDGLDLSPMAVIGRLSRVTAHLHKRLQDNYDRYAVNSGEFDVLASLRRSGSPYRLTPTELYNALMISSGAVTNRLDRLEKSGLISRAPNPEDRRGILVSLTGKGIAFMNEAYPAHLAHEEGLLAALAPGERDQLILLLRKLLISYESEA